MLAIWLKKHRSFFEFALRVYIAYYLFDYGLAKLTGNMFNNTTPAMLKTELQKVDLFHLTWYFFARSTLLSYTAGICQILAALLLLFNRTVLLGCMIALPVWVNIFIIDLGIFPDHVLAVRVFEYMACTIFFVVYRREAVMAAWRVLMQNTRAFKMGKWYYLLFLPLLFGVYLLLEIVFGFVLKYIF